MPVSSGWARIMLISTLSTAGITTPHRRDQAALHDVVKGGKARYIGASAMYAWQFQQALHVAEQNGWTLCLDAKSLQPDLPRRGTRDDATLPGRKDCLNTLQSTGLAASGVTWRRRRHPAVLITPRPRSEIRGCPSIGRKSSKGGRTRLEMPIGAPNY